MTTWYVRPDASHGGTNAGTSYANAWQGWSSITWGGGGVQGGDTLYVCGNHSYSATITVGAHGASSDAARATISGNYPDDPGSITFVGAYYLNNSRSYTLFDALTITGDASSSVYMGATQSFVSFVGCVFNGNAGNGSIVALSGTGARTYSDILFDGCTFTGDARNASSGSGAINWLVGTGAVSNLVRVTIQNCAFVDLVTGRGAIHLRIEAAADVSSSMADMQVLNNTFSGVQGHCIELSSGFDVFSSSAGMIVSGNAFDLCTVSPVSGSGSCMALWGFGPSTSDGFGEALISDNRGTNCVSDGGFIDLFFGSYVVRDNYADTFSTDTIDANGVLFDYGCSECKVYRNTFKNLTGKAGVVNSGCGIMVLDSTSIWCFGNLVENCLTGIYFGSATSVHSTGQSAVIEGNTIIDCSVHGVYLMTSADKATTVVRNNILTASDGAVPSVTNVGAAWTADELNNCFYGFAAASGHTLDASDITADPEIDANGHPQDGSPMIAAGVHTGYRRDGRGNAVWNPPTIGAFEFQRARTSRL